ncbi:MAG: F0F1 ATP synthase subunit delta [Burkholderiaceae bacterium]|nr:F0F1 ATP synthase subunit delta [Burkholderiaceae bacterium]
MAEISTIARPYAEALFAATKDSEDSALADKLELVLDSLEQVCTNSLVVEVERDPKATNADVYALLRNMLPHEIPSEADCFLRLVIENDKVDAIPEIRKQFGLLVDKARGEAEVIIETPFPLEDVQLNDLLTALSRKFNGLKLKPRVVIDESLIGGVRVSVGDQVLDGTVKTRLAEMQVALTR